MTIKLKAFVTEDRRLELSLPPEVPAGDVELLLSSSKAIAAGLLPTADSDGGFDLLGWADKYSEPLGEATSSEDVARFTGRRF